MKTHKLYTLGFVIMFFMFGCQRNPDKELIIGKWQSLNDPGLVIEFTNSGHYYLYRGGVSMFENVENYGHLKYNFNPSIENYNLDITGENNNKQFVKANIEIIDSNRIRVFFYNHHNILDLGDEFNKTYDFTSYSDIMKTIVDKE